jgi:uncharacterized protein YsxB (DUF464 family)
MKAKVALAAFGTILAFLAIVVGLTFFGNELDYRTAKRYAPLQEQVRRNTFEQSQSYNEGMIRDLENIHNQYLHSTNDAEKTSLALTFVQRAEAYPNFDALPADLQSFYHSVNK